jgi:phage-related protein
MLEFHGYISEQKPTTKRSRFRLLQLADFSQFNVAEDVIRELCTWRYKSAQCGSTGSAAACPKRFIDCKDATRAAQERFNGVLASAPASAVVNVRRRL